MPSQSPHEKTQWFAYTTHLDPRNLRAVHDGAANLLVRRIAPRETNACVARFSQDQIQSKFNGTNASRPST